MTKTGNRKKAGRPAGAAARYPGITEFCRATGYTHQHVRLVLDGRRESKRLAMMWRSYTRGAK